MRYKSVEVGSVEDDILRNPLDAQVNPTQLFTEVASVAGRVATAPQVEQDPEVDDYEHVVEQDPEVDDYENVVEQDPEVEPYVTGAPKVPGPLGP